MLVVAGVINYMDRATLAVANPLIREELGLSIAQMGYLLSAFLGAYAFAQLPVGALVDKAGPRLLRTAAEVQSFQSLGFRWLAVSTDLSILREGFRQIAGRAKP